MWQYQNTDELYHYGVLGMRWGVRRYQNANGTLTSIGKKRYGTSDTVKNIQNKKDAIKKRKNSYLGKESERVDKVFDKTYARDLNYLTKNGMRKGKAEKKAFNNALSASNAYDEKITAKYRNDMKNLKKDLKNAKKDRKKKINATTKDIMKKSKFAEKFIYNKATFKKAAKYMVDNDASADDAKRMAKTEAKRNTLAALAVIGGGYLYTMKKIK